MAILRGAHPHPNPPPSRGRTRWGLSEIEKIFVLQDTSCFFEKLSEKALYWEMAYGCLYARGQLSLNMR